MSDTTESSSDKEGSDEQVPGSSSAGAKRKHSSDESDQNPDGNADIRNSIQERSGETPLHYSELTEREKMVWSFLATGHGIGTTIHYKLYNICSITLTNANTDSVLNVQNEFGQIPLHCAAVWGSEEGVRTMLASGANANLQDQCGMTPLHCALERGYDSLALTILNAVTEINIQDEDKRTPLHYAAIRGLLESVKKLLVSGANTRLQDAWGKTPLHNALQQKHVSVALIIMNTNADNNIQDNDGKTPLHCAAECGFQEIVQKMLASGANVNLQDEYGMSPLHCALERGHDSLALIILNAATEINIQDGAERIPLHCAASMGLLESVKKLLDSGANTCLQDAWGKTPLHNALKHKRVSVALVIMNADVYNDIQDNDGKTPLHYAAECGSEEIVQRMLASGASVRLQDNNGWTPLHIALNCHDRSVALTILNTDFVDIQDKDGNTPLHFAIEVLDVAKKLLFNDVNPHCMNNNGISPLESALRLKNNVVAEIILSMCVLKNIAIEWEDVNVPEDGIQLCIQYVKECNAEIQCLKNANVGGTLFSYHEAATEHVNKLAVHLENDLIRSALLRDNNWELEFPIYGELISFKVRNAETRRILRAQFFECFTFLSRSLPSLPRIGIDVILTYLSDREVRNFVEAFQLKE